MTVAEIDPCLSRHCANRVHNASIFYNKISLEYCLSLLGLPIKMYFSLRIKFLKCLSLLTSYGVMELGLIQVVAYGITATSHYMNQYRLIANLSLGNRISAIVSKKQKHYHSRKCICKANVVCKLLAFLFMPWWVEVCVLILTIYKSKNRNKTQRRLKPLRWKKTY